MVHISTTPTPESTTMTTQTPIFVYGTLRTGQGNYAWALANRTTNEQRATLSGAIMHDNNGGFPFVTTIDASPAHVVVGDLMDIAPDQYEDVVNALDGLEGYHGPNYPGNMYDRVLVTVTTETGEQVEAYTYLVASDLYERRVSRLPIIASGDWMDVVRAHQRRYAAPLG